MAFARGAVVKKMATLEHTFFFITPVYLQSVQNTMSKWEETDTNGEEESSVALIHMEEWVRGDLTD
jgi:hypothetical protein